MDEAVGKLYVERHFPPESKAKIDALVANLIAAYRANIEKLEWMGPETRARALEKLNVDRHEPSRDPLFDDPAWAAVPKTAREGLILDERIIVENRSWIPKLWLELLTGLTPVWLAPLRFSGSPDIASLNVSATSPATSLSPSEVSSRSSAALFKRSPALPAASLTAAGSSPSSMLAVGYARQPSRRPPAPRPGASA